VLWLLQTLLSLPLPPRLPISAVACACDFCRYDGVGMVQMFLGCGLR
jgi:hypothetical protein